MMPWRESWRADPGARRIVDNHYSRQSRGAAQFVPPGRCVVLVIHEASALEIAMWTTSWPFPEYVKHAWPGAWVCSAFRQQRMCSGCQRVSCVDHPESATYALYRSSDLIVDAVAATRWYWQPPDQGMITFVDPTKVIHKRDPGRCFRKAGFHVAGDSRTPCSCTPGPSSTKDGKLALHLSPEAMPPAAQPRGAVAGLFAERTT